MFVHKYIITTDITEERREFCKPVLPVFLNKNYFQCAFPYSIPVAIRESKGNQKVKSIIVTEVTVRSPFITYSSQNPWNFLDNIMYKCYKWKISSKVILSFIVPSTQAAFAICIAREILCFKKLHALGSSVHMLRILQSLLKKNFCAGAGRALNFKS